MKLPLFEAYARMVPRLSAQNSLRAATETALGSGAMKKEHAAEIQRGWARAAEPRRRARKATDKDLASLPIKVTRVPVKTGE